MNLVNNTEEISTEQITLRRVRGFEIDFLGWGIDLHIVSNLRGVNGKNGYFAHLMLLHTDFMYFEP